MASWLRHCATSQKVMGSISNGVTGIFRYRINLSMCTMALRLTQPLTEMSTMNISWVVQVASVEGCQLSHLHVPIVLKSGRLNLLEPSRLVQTCNACAFYANVFYI